MCQITQKFPGNYEEITDSKNKVLPKTCFGWLHSLLELVTNRHFFIHAKNVGNHSTNYTNSIHIEKKQKKKKHLFCKEVTQRPKGQKKTLSMGPSAAASHRENQGKEEQCINLLAANLPLSQLIKLKCITNITLSQ